MNSKEDYPPFFVELESVDNWQVVIEHPKDICNFVIVHKGKKEDCQMICSALNDLFDAHLDNCLNEVNNV